MKTKIINLYSFDELSEEAKQKAIENLSDINLNDWHDQTYEDADQIGLKIKGFDIGRGDYVEGEFITSPMFTAHEIIENHGEICDTHKTATKFIEDFNNISERYKDNELTEDEADSEEVDLNEEFLSSLCNDYLKMLRESYEYLSSEEAIIETIQANEYDFTEDGKLA